MKVTSQDIVTIKLSPFELFKYRLRRLYDMIHWFVKGYYISSLPIILFRRKLKKDRDLYLAFKSSMAMMFKDNVRIYKHNTGKKYLSSSDIHIIANDTAERFLDLFIL